MKRTRGLVEEVDDYEDDILYAIATENNTRLQQLLALLGVCSVNFKTQHGATLLHHACCHGYPQIVRTFLDNDAQVGVTDRRNRTPLHNSCWGECQNVEICKLLIERGADVNAKDSHGNTPLHFACQHPCFELAKLLVENGADPNNKIKCSGETPLHKVFNEGLDILNEQSLKIAKLLIESGADVNARTQDTHNSKTPLHMVCCNENNLEAAQLLIDNGADIDAQDKDGETPLHCACTCGHLSAVQLLVTRGANVSMEESRRRETPLHIACKRHHFEIVWFFVRQNPSLVL